MGCSQDAALHLGPLILIMPWAESQETAPRDSGQAPVPAPVPAAPLQAALRSSTRSDMGAWEGGSCSPDLLVLCAPFFLDPSVGRKGGEGCPS